MTAIVGPLVGRIKALSAIVALTLLSTVAQAQQPPAGGPPAPPPGSLKVHAISSTLYWIEGGGGNVGVIIGDKGVVLVDTTIAAASGREVLDDVAKITSKPVLAVILTHGDVDHVRGLAAFPAGVQIIAQENTRKRLEAELAGGRGNVQADRMPNHVVAEREAIDIGGVKLQLLHWAPAHTGGDLVVYLPTQKVVFTGDIVATDQQLALIHLETGGSSAGWITTAKGIVALDAAQFVPGHGGVQTKQDVQQRIDRVVAERDRIKVLVGEGRSLAQIQAEVGDPQAGTASRFTPFSEAVYRELTQKAP